jgi:secondary thiamine-phosphate synthase enzyme
MQNFSVKTTAQVQMIDITPQIQAQVKKSRVKEGVATIYVPHTTAGIIINENADPAVIRDIIKELDKVIPFNNNYQHLEGNAAAHIKSSVVGCSCTVIISGGKLALGTWQSIFFCEFDGPRIRNVYVQIIPSIIEQ